jgi:hypothetical protein
MLPASIRLEGPLLQHWHLLLRRARQIKLRCASASGIYFNNDAAGILAKGAGVAPVAAPSI